MDIVIGMIVGLIVLMLLVTAHEFGHFIAARRNGVRVLEFGIGFPPRAVAWVKDPETKKWRRLTRDEWDKGGINKTVLSGSQNAQDQSAYESSEKTEVDDKKLIQPGMIFSLNWLPIGGFCQMDGESATDEREGTFGKASFWSKTKILFAGVAMNWLVAWVILTMLAWTGMPQYLDNQFTVESDTRYSDDPVLVISVAEGSPAERAGFKTNDRILAVDGNEFRRGSEITEYNSAHAGGEVTYTLGMPVTNCTENLDGGQSCSDDGAYAVREVTVTLNESDASYLLGVSMETAQTLAYSTWSAPITGAGLTLQMTGETFKGVGQLVWNLITGVGSQFSFNEEVRESGQESLSEVKDSVSGPVGIVGMIFPAFASMGLPSVLYLAALISISLACMNVLPIPALDGGRWLLIGWYKLRKKPLTKEMEEKIVSRAMMVLLALIFIITVIDITRFFG